MRASTSVAPSLLLVAVLLTAPAAADIKIAFIDPLSGGGAATGILAQKTHQFYIDAINAAGGVNGEKIELLSFDNKVNPQESLIQLKKALDDGARYVVQGNGSSIAHAITEAVLKHNERNPGKEVLYLNYAAVDPALTNEKCNFWHFRFDADADMKMAAMTDVIAKDSKIKKVYLINQDYSFGKAVAAAANRMLAEKRPDIKIVGDEMIPLMQVKDFSPYITKIKASGADSLLTGNYGPDLALLIKAGVDAGLNIRYDSYLGHVIGAPTAIGAAGDGRLTSVMEIHDNISVEENNAAQEEFVKQWRATHDFGFIAINSVTQFDMLVRAIEKAGSTDPLKVALALEGMEQKDMFGAVNIMRKDDHQLLNPYYEAVLTKGQKYDVEKTGMGWKTEFKTTVADETLPTTCKMKRPES